MDSKQWNRLLRAIGVKLCIAGVDYTIGSDSPGANTHLNVKINGSPIGLTDINVYHEDSDNPKWYQIIVTDVDGEPQLNGPQNAFFDGEEADATVIADKVIGVYRANNKN